MKNIKKAMACTVMCALLITCTLGENAVSDDGSGETKADFSSGLYMTSTPIEVVDMDEPVVRSNGILEGVGKCSYKKSVIINGKKNLLLFKFDDPSEALANVKEKDKDVLEKMSEEFGLDELTADNWQDYKDVLDQHSGGVLFSDETNSEKNISKQRTQLGCFFDIYENDDKNSATLELVSEANDYLKTHKQVAIDEIINGLPYTDPAVSTYQDKAEEERNSGIHTNQISGLNNVTEANNYAEAYAEIPNTSDYYNFPRGDCTNFVSQICYAGGVPMTSSWNWYGYFNHTNSWTVADDFCKHFKPRWHTGVTPAHFFNFSKQLYTKGGSVIAYDEYSDNDWDHMGYVVARSSSTYFRYNENFDTDFEFYNFKVAQHTGNYLLWADNEDNGWPVILNSESLIGIFS